MKGPIHVLLFSAAFVLGMARAPAPALAQGSNSLKVAIVTTSVVNLSERDANDVVLAIAAAIRRELKVIALADVATQANATQVAPNLDQCVVEAACVSRLRDALSVDAVLFVALARVGGITRVDIRYIAPDSNTSVQVLDDTIDKPDLATFAARARDLVPDAELRSQGSTAVTSPTTTTTTTPPATVHGGTSRVTTRVILSGSLTLAAAGAATFFGLRALACQDGDDPCSQSEADGADRDALITDILLGATALGAIVTGYLVWRGEDPPSSTVGVAPTANGGSVVWTTAF